MKEKKSMRSATLPRESWEKSYDCLDSSDLKYASEFGNPEELKKNADALSSYVKKNQYKY